MPCPVAGQVQVLTPGGVPANLGSPVQIVAVGFVFGSATGTSGTVTLSRAGVQPRVLPSQQVTWSPVAVSFIVPSDLPVAAGDTSWEVRLQATGSAEVCGPYTLMVRAVPVLVFVPPTSVSERRLDVAAIGIGSTAQVRFYDRFDKRIAHNFPAQQRTPTGIACQVPTLREIMESSTDCDVNQLTMLLYVRVFDPESGIETAKSELHKTVVALPPPAMGPLAAATAPDRLIFGDASRPTELGDQLSLEWVGAPDRGKVTFHPLDATLLEKVTSIHRQIGGALNVQNPDLTLPVSTVKKADAVKNAGTSAQIAQWTEEKIEAIKPSGWTDGVVLIWRDSLPTMPLVIPKIPIPDLCNPTVLEAAVRKLFSLKVPNLQLAPNDRLQAELIPADGNASLTTTAQELKKLVQDKVAKLDITYSVVGGTEFTDALTRGPSSTDWTKPVALTTTTDWAKPVAVASNLLARPNIVRQELDPDTENTVFRLEIDIKVTGLPGCAGALTVTLVGPNITQLPIRLPTLAAFFDLRGNVGTPNAWGGDGLVCVHPASSLVGGAVDRDDIGGVGRARAAILGPITAARDVLVALELFFPSILGASSLSMLTTFIDILGTRSVNALVITDEAARGRLNYNPTWWDKASSMFMIGVPDGSTTLRIFEGDNQTGNHFCEFRIPAGFIAASYWTLHESAFREGDRDFYQSPPAVPDPGVLQDGRSDAYPFDSFGNMAKSFRWVSV